MDTAKLNDWLTVVTNIGVIAGLVLLAYEISQTNESLEQDAAALSASYFQDSQERWTRFLLPIVENPDVAGIWVKGGAGDSLDVVEAERYRYLTDTLFWSVAFQLASEELAPQAFDADISPTVVTLESYLKGKPGLRARFDEWVKLYPSPGANLSRLVGEVSAQG